MIPVACTTLDNRSSYYAVYRLEYNNIDKLIRYDLAVDFVHGFTSQQASTILHALLVIYGYLMPVNMRKGLVLSRTILRIFMI